MANRVTAKEVLLSLEKHEAECLIHLQNISEKVESIDEHTRSRFDFLQNAILGLYAVIITGGIAVILQLL